MKNRLLIIALAIIDAALLFVGLYSHYFLKDSEAPEIVLVDVDITYKEGDDTSKLLTGIRAEDNVDGNITSNIFIEKIVSNGNDSVIVYYGVVDSSNNATIASRVVNYEKAVEEVSIIDTDLEVEDSENIR